MRVISGFATTGMENDYKAKWYPLAEKSVLRLDDFGARTHRKRQAAERLLNPPDNPDDFVTA